jgi:putative endonuclease
MSGRLTQSILHLLDRLAPADSPDEPEHLRIGRRGEEDAYFYLRRHGYTMIARNFRSPHHRGEIDLIGWHKVPNKVRDKAPRKVNNAVNEKLPANVPDKTDQDILCFIEVKTRTTRDVSTAEAAVDREKQNDLRLVARDFLRHLPAHTFPVPLSLIASPGPAQPACRFDIISVYYDLGLTRPTFELFQNAFSLAYNQKSKRSHQKN